MTRLVLSLCGAYGVFLLYTRWMFGWRGAGLGPRVAGGAGMGERSRALLAAGLVRAGLEGVALGELLAASLVLGAVGAGSGYAVFGGVLASSLTGLGAAVVPVLAARQRRRQRLEAAHDAWPRMIEEIRLAASALGEPLPQALLAAGLRGPVQMRAAFEAAQRAWLLSCDFERTVATLKRRLADATADVVCETLLVAHEVGGSDVARRLSALAEDRVADLQGRKDAAAEQAGVRFARRFVLLVPLGMALAGLRIGDGRAAYATPAGQTGVACSLLLIALCWLWAGRMLRLPVPERVFGGDGGD